METAAARIFRTIHIMSFGCGAENHATRELYDSILQFGFVGFDSPQLDTRLDTISDTTMARQLTADFRVSAQETHLLFQVNRVVDILLRSQLHVQPLEENTAGILCRLIIFAETIHPMWCGPFVLHAISTILRHNSLLYGECLRLAEYQRVFGSKRMECGGTMEVSRIQ